MAHALELVPALPIVNALNAVSDVTKPSAAADPVQRGSARPPDTAERHTRAIRAVAAGDRDAFSQLYADYVRMVHAIVLGRVRPSEVDDIVQDVFLTAYTRLHELRDPAAFGGWLATIARHRATDHLRRAREDVPLPGDVPGGTAVESETLAVLEAIRTLPEAYRETLLMRLVEGMTGQEIADRTGLSAGSVRVNLHRGMKLLRETLRMEGS
jgi:RNA polymerase sigma-70 factor (ECF subfamily)